MDASRYAELFLTEARDHVTAINQALIDLEHASGGDARDPLDAIFRAVHTVKGMSGVMEYGAITSLSHAMETLLARVRAGQEALTPGQVSLLFDSADALERAIESANPAEGSALDVAGLVQRLQGRSGPDETLPDDARGLQLDLPDGPGVAIEVTLEPGTILPGARAQLVLARVHTLGTMGRVVPDDAEMMAESFTGHFAVRIETDADDEQIRATLTAAGFVRDVRVVRTPRPAVAASETNFDAAWSNEALKAPLQRYVRIDLRRLDHLMNLAGELMIVRGRLAQQAMQHRDPALDDAVTEAARLIGELQDGVLGGRMVPVWQVFDRFPRVVRDAASLLGKEVEFTLEGREIELDRSLLEQVADPLVHLLRNAVDHGIEAPADRVAAGKRAVGRLTLSATRERSAVVIRLRDDGRGIDRARVLRKAQALGLVDVERERLDDDELARIIARPGFSTSDRVTELSGRGVGMDAVYSRIRTMGGLVDLKTVEGEGTTFSLRLPVTLAVIPALLARVGGEAYALPLSHVRETMQRRGGCVRTVRGREVIVIREEVLPLLHLRDIVGLPREEGAPCHVVILEIAERRAGLVVDRLLGREEIVVKPFDAVQGGASCFNGATIMGDGSAALILEVSSLL
ncbi:MAG: chemotaxis protein CheA [Gemmatimonadaceae bacterium]